MDEDGEFTHLDGKGHARMVDVGDKDETRRRAVARAKVTMSSETVARLSGGVAPKGDVLAAARLAGIQAAKRTSELVPLCHPVCLTSVAVDLSLGRESVEVEASAETVGRTGVEMEALMACAIAALTVYAMCKAFDRSIAVEGLALWEKSGGRSGHWRRNT